MMKRKHLLVLIVSTLFSVSLASFAARRQPYKGSRIFWDNSTRRTVFGSGGYARVIQLHDGRLMAVCESNGINIAFSSNKGGKWSSPIKIVTNTNNVPNCAPDLIQLADGTIIVGYNPRPSQPYTKDRRFGIRCKRSTNNGRTWSGEIFVNDASYTFEDGCWEPSFLELPSGELQLYFADEGPYTTSGEQQISMCRSYDGGLTWTDAQKVSFRAGSRDGMPSAIILQDKKTIALAFEDNGWRGVNNFIPTIATCPLETNWNDYWVSGASGNRWKAIDYNYCTLRRGGAPYLRKLPWGETILSHQGENGNGVDMSKQQMWVYVGNEEARDFKAMSEPFGDDNSLWNSLSVIDTGTVVAVGGMSGRVDMIKGRALRQLCAPYGHPKVDGRYVKNEGYYTSFATQMILGHSTNKVRFSADFAYDEDTLYFTSRVSDVTQHPLKSVYGDGVTLFLDTRYASDEHPVDGMHRLFFLLAGDIVTYEGSTGKNSWVPSELAGVRSVVKTANAGKVYTIEAAIPWKSLGYDKAPEGHLMRANIMLHDNRTGGDEVSYSMLPDAQRDASWSWMDFSVLEKPSASGVGTVDADKDVSVILDGNNVCVRGNVVKVELFSPTGAKVCESKDKILAKPAGGGLFIARLTLAGGRVATHKLTVR